MIRLNIHIAIAIMITSLTVLAQDKITRIAIIKADDVRGISAKWERFIRVSNEKGVKVSAGIICNSLQGNKKDYFDWLKKHNSSGLVEFWNHGWDHKLWNTGENKKISEFGGSGYEHQKKHFDDSQKLMKKILGESPVAFGTPFNACDADTIRVMNEDDDMRLFFCYKVKGLEGKVLAPMNLRGESDGTGKPNFDKFKAQYLKKKDVSFSAIQFHPNSFSDASFVEYARILDFLIAEGWTFMLPVEYVSVTQ